MALPQEHQWDVVVVGGVPLLLQPFQGPGCWKILAHLTYTYTPARLPLSGGMGQGANLGMKQLIVFHLHNCRGDICALSDVTSKQNLKRRIA